MDTRGIGGLLTQTSNKLKEEIAVGIDANRQRRTDLKEAQKELAGYEEHQTKLEALWAKLLDVITSWEMLEKERTELENGS